MVHCSKCGTALSPDARFCNKCGQEQPAVAGQQPAAVAQSGLSEKAAATLSYLLGWITGIIFFLIDRRPYVRFHAAQSIVTFGGLHLIRMCLGIFLGFGWAFGGDFSFGHWGGGYGIGLALAILSFVGLILWIVCMIKAYQGERFMVPIAGDIASNLARQ